MECNDWPGTEDDIFTINDVVLQRHSDTGAGVHVTAVGSGTSRKGKPAIAISHSKPGKRWSPDEVAVLSFKGKSYQIVQGFCELQAQSPGDGDQVNEDTLEARYTVVAGNPPAIQTRRLKDNHLLQSSSPLPAGIRVESAVPGESGGCHVTGRDEEDLFQVFLVNGAGKVVQVPIGNSKSPPSSTPASANLPFGKGRVIKAGRINNRSIILVTVPEDGVTGSQELAWLRLEDSEVKEAGTLVLKTRLAIDGSDILPVEGGFYVAAVTGDSLVGEGSLHLSFYKLDQTVRTPVWSNVIPLPHTHVAAPRLFHGGSGAAGLLLPKWVDRESTVGSYKLSPKGFSRTGIHGVFPEPVLILDIAENSAGALFMVKMRRGKDWQQNLCEFVW